MTRRPPPSPADLNALTDADLLTTQAHVAGILAARVGGYRQAETLRRIADALLAAPKQGRAA